MKLQPHLRSKLEKLLSTVDDQGSLGPRLKGDAARLWERVRKFAAMNLIGPEFDSDALELACYARCSYRRDRPGGLCQANWAGPICEIAVSSRRSFW